MLAGPWWHTPSIPALGRQRQADLSKFEASLVYKESSRTARAITQRNPVLEKKKQTTTTTIKKKTAKNPTNQPNKKESDALG